MKHIVPISGGKDSQATALWCRDHINAELIYVFNDTGWEHIKTYEHLLYLQECMNIEIIVLTNKRYPNGMVDLVRKKGRFPSTMARFCTEELKTKPMIDFILEQNDDMIIYQGIRAEESKNRAKMEMAEDFFRHYFEAYSFDESGKGKYRDYRRKEVKYFAEFYKTIVMRPIFKWTVDAVFEYISSHNQKVNPLYYTGVKRVGCYPCIMCGLGEVKIIAQNDPSRLDEIADIENEVETTFFPIDYIPERFCSKPVTRKDGVPAKAPLIEDVKKYVYDANQIEIFDAPTCQSVYNICE